MGWTWDTVIDTLTIPRLLALNRHWREYPPLHITVASFMEAGRFGRAKKDADSLEGDQAWAAL